MSDSYAQLSGDLAELFLVTGEAVAGRPDAVFKVAREPRDNDLLAAEARALTRLTTDGDPKLRAYMPRLLETFTHEDPATGERRAANVLEYQAGFVSLAQVAEKYPDGLDPRDAAWMWRRLLVALGAAHRVGLVHGAVLPEHVLIHPGAHGLVLVDWCYSTSRPGEHVPALVARYRDAYPPEVPAREQATAATDVYMAGGLFLKLMGDRTPPELRRFAAGCRLARPRMRPQDAWALLAELDDLLNTLYGPRRFRAFAVPA
jgi:serine/threonine protein kinase